MRSVAGEALDRAVAQHLVRAIQEAARPPRGKSDVGATLGEIAETTGMSRSWVSFRLTKLVAEGKVKVGFRIGEDVLGRVRRIPVYRVCDGDGTSPSRS